MKIMKLSTKLVAALAVLGGSLGGVANAGPTTWVDYKSFGAGGVLVDFWHPVVYTHDITSPAGFVPGVDDVDSYSLRFDLWDDQDSRREKHEIALFSQPGSLLDAVFFEFSGTEGTNNWTFAGVWQLEHTGRLTVAISALVGDFYLGSSTLRVRGQQHAVPEPGTLALFGVALLGFGLIRRKRVNS